MNFLFSSSSSSIRFYQLLLVVGWWQTIFGFCFIRWYCLLHALICASDFVISSENIEYFKLSHRRRCLHSICEFLQCLWTSFPVCSIIITACLYMHVKCRMLDDMKVQIPLLHSLEGVIWKRNVFREYTICRWCFSPFTSFADNMFRWKLSSSFILFSIWFLPQNK